MSTVSGDIIRFFIHDFRIDLSIGVQEDELRKTQPVIINVECEAELTCRYDNIAEKTLDRVIDYSLFYHFIRNDLPQMGHIYLLETAAEQIVAFCLRDERVQKVSVRIEKTSVFPDVSGAGIELVRTRS